MPPPPVSNFSGKTRHPRHQRPGKYHVALVAAHDVPFGVALYPLAQALGEPALARNVLDAQIAHVLSEANIQLPDADARRPRTILPLDQRL